MISVVGFVICKNDVKLLLTEEAGPGRKLKHSYANVCMVYANVCSILRKRLCKICTNAHRQIIIGLYEGKAPFNASTMQKTE